MPKKKRLLNEAARARWLAERLSDPDTTGKLRRYADECEAEAARLEDAQRKRASPSED